MRNRSQTGKTVVQISNETQISRGHLYALEKDYPNNPTMIQKERSGRPLKYDSHTERRIVRAFEKDPMKTSTKMTKEINQGMEEEEQLSTRTVSRIAVNNGLKSRRPCVKPQLLENHIFDRLTFAREYVSRTSHFWMYVLYCDEVKVELDPIDARKRVRRRTGERLVPKNVVGKSKFGGGSVMYWGCLTWNGPGPLVLIPDTLKADNYKVLLENQIPQIKQNMNMQSPYLLEDHSSTHDSHLIKQTKEDLNLRTLNNFPARSPDLNPIENLWSYWKDRIRERNPQTLDKLQVYASQEWNRITVDICRKYISSMPRRLQAIIEAKGSYTKY